ncbi:MAG: surface-adhesin E family protein [Blastocatellales bacterium]
MRRFVMIVLLVSCCLIAIPAGDLYAQESAKPEWKYVTFSYGPHGEKDKVFYDTKNVEQTSEGFTQVRLKYLGVHDNEQEKQKRLDALKQNREHNGFSLKDYDRFAYSVMVVEFDCKKKLRRYPCVMDYDGNDKRIGDQCIEELPWQKIPEESLAKIVFDAVCGSK